MKTLKIPIRLSTLIILLLFCFITVNGQTKLKYISNSLPPRLDYKPIDLKTTKGNWVYLDVPSYLWSYGCVATSVAMLVGYYDRHGFFCLYNGNVLDGAAPKDNCYWKSNHFYDIGAINYDNSISASKYGVDGRTERGHVDDFWNKLGGQASNGYPDPHPWYGNVPPHIFFADNKPPCVADYLGSSQNYYNMADGSVIHYTNADNSRLYDFVECESYNPPNKDLTHGLKEFFEFGSGNEYSVNQVYTQPIFGLDGIKLDLHLTILKQKLMLKDLY